MVTLKCGRLRYLDPRVGDGGKWEYLNLRLSQSDLAPDPAHHAEPAPECAGWGRAPVQVSDITGVHVYLGGLFIIKHRSAPALRFLVEGDSSAARGWADAIYAARLGVGPAEAARLRTFFRPCIAVDVSEATRNTPRAQHSLDLRRLRSQLQLLGIEPKGVPVPRQSVGDLNEDSDEDCEEELEGLRLGSDLVVLPNDAQTSELLKKIISKVRDAHVTEIWENGRVDFPVGELGDGDPPGFQRSDGSSLSSAEMVRGLREKWSWLCDWEVDKDPLLFGPEGWQHAASFVNAQWDPQQKPNLKVRRRRWFRVQMDAPCLVQTNCELGAAGEAPLKPGTFKAAAALSMDSLLLLASEMCNNPRCRSPEMQAEMRKEGLVLELAVAADRCSSGGSALDLLLYLVPGQPKFVDLEEFNVSVPKKLSPEQLAIKLSGQLLDILDGSSMARMTLQEFCEAGKFKVVADSDIGHLRHSRVLENEDPVQATYSFKMTKVNERGRKQERMLQLSNDGVKSFRGDSERFHYPPEDIHGIHATQDEELGFDLCLITRINYVANSPQQRLQVS